MPRNDPSKFDPSKSLVMGRFNTVGGHALAAGSALTIVEEPKERGEVTLETATRLWASGTFVYADKAHPTPVESPQDAARRLVAMEETGNGWYLIRAPWLGEGEKVQGREAAEARKAELIEAGQPDDYDPNAAATDAGDEGDDATDETDSPETDIAIEERIRALSGRRSEAQLRDQVAEIDRARAEAGREPLGAKSDHNKTDLARLIVGVDGDLEQEPSGASVRTGGGDATETGGDNTGGETQSED